MIATLLYLTSLLMTVNFRTVTSKIQTLLPRIFTKKKSLSTTIKQETGHVFKRYEGVPNIPVGVQSFTPVKPKVPKIALLLIPFVVIAYLVILFRSWLIIATVDGRTITRVNLWQKMENTYGIQALDDLINQQILLEAVEKAKVTVTDEQIKTAYSELDKRLQVSNSVESSMLKRGMSKESIQQQILLQLKINELLKDKIQPTEDEIQNEYTTNKNTLYKGKEFSEVRPAIVSTLLQKNSNREFQKWFNEVKAASKVNYFHQYK